MKRRYPRLSLFHKIYFCIRRSNLGGIKKTWRISKSLSNTYVIRKPTAWIFKILSKLNATFSYAISVNILYIAVIEAPGTHTDANAHVSKWIFKKFQKFYRNNVSNVTEMLHKMLICKLQPVDQVITYVAYVKTLI